MKKQILFCIFCLLLAIPGPAKCDESSRRGIFVTVVQEPVVLSSREEINKLIDFAKDARIKILFVQIYRANQAWFASQVADSGPYEACLKNLKEDAFGFLIKQAHGAGLEVHAWLNLLSLADNKNAKLLKKYGTSILTKNLKEKKTLQDYKIDDQYFLEPGDTRVRNELSNMIEEILRAYPELDGIQFDYIRYPDKNPAYGYTKMNIEHFKKATGRKIIEENSRAWKDWKRAQVTGLLEQLVKKARALRPGIQVSATGCATYFRAYDEAFQDWPSWLARGLVDFVTFMSYSPDLLEFEKWIATAKSKCQDFKKVNIGVGAYKLVSCPGTFKEEFQLCEKERGNACVIFHYGSLLLNPSLSSFLVSDKKTGKTPEHRK